MRYNLAPYIDRFQYYSLPVTYLQADSLSNVKYFYASELCVPLKNWITFSGLVFQDTLGTYNRVCLRKSL